MELSKVIFVLFFVYLAAPAMGKKVAGLVVFRRVDSRIEYLMLKPSKENKEWSPPKGKTPTYPIQNQVLRQFRLMLA